MCDLTFSVTTHYRSKPFWSFLDHLTIVPCIRSLRDSIHFLLYNYQWRAQEKIRAERSLALSAEESKGPSSDGAETLEERQGPSSHGAQTSSSPSEPPLSSEAYKDLEETEERGKLDKRRVELSAVKPVLIEIDDEPEVIVVE